MSTDIVYAFLKNKKAKATNRIQINFKNVINVIFILRLNTFIEIKHFFILRVFEGLTIHEQKLEKLLRVVFALTVGKSFLHDFLRGLTHHEKT